jgi:hypothetical protein
MQPFLTVAPTLEDYWRGIILFGRNSASYKFALAKSLLELNPQAGQLLKLTDLAPAFAKHIVTHLKQAPKQALSASSQYLEACRLYGVDDPNQTKLVEETVRRGFVNVIDAFHVVGAGDTQKRFFIDERASNNGIRITDEFSALMSGSYTQNLGVEVESRWNLVETAWAMGVAPHLIDIKHDVEQSMLFTFDRTNRRKTVTSARGALNGYQKGKCFYCRCEIDITTGLETEVDHFFPHVLSREKSFELIDGVWNLVLACVDCNAGVGGKFARIPTIPLLERLETRNNFLIASHHPLRETLINQTGATESARRRFLSDFHNRAIARLFHTWEPDNKGDLSVCI